MKENLLRGVRNLKIKDGPMPKNLLHQIEYWKKKRIKFSEFDKIVLERKESFEEIEIGKLAKREADKWIERKRFGGHAPLIITDTIFSLNRPYKQMVKNILRPFYLKFPEMNLDRLAKCRPLELYKRFTFASSTSKSGHPLSNLNRWRNIIEITQRIMKYYGNDIDAVYEWATDVNLEFYRNDPIKRGLKGIGISAIQYLRMQAGVDTVKPDIRVKKALADLDIVCPDDLETIKVCEKFAKGLGIRPMEFDFILWYSRERLVY